MKRILVLLLVLAMCLPFAACSFFEDKVYAVALITIPDGTSDRGASHGVNKALDEYCTTEKISYNCYTAEEYTAESIDKQVSAAVKNGAKVLVFAGDSISFAAKQAVLTYSDVDILTVDCNPKVVNSRIHSVSFRDEQGGFLAGYAAVADGIDSFGFIAGIKNSISSAYFSGFIQGLEYAAGVFDVPAIDVKCWYTESLVPDEYIKTTSQSWYGSGTKAIMICGEGIQKSVISAANIMKSRTIGTDIDQAGYSERYLTSAVKDYFSVISETLDSYFKNDGWTDDKSGKTAVYSVETDKIGLPTLKGSFRFSNWDKDDYEVLYSRLKSKAILVSDSETVIPTVCRIEYFPSGIPELPEEESSTTQSSEAGNE